MPHDIKAAHVSSPFPDKPHLPLPLFSPLQQWLEYSAIYSLPSASTTGLLEPTPGSFGQSLYNVSPGRATSRGGLRCPRRRGLPFKTRPAINLIRPRAPGCRARRTCSYNTAGDLYYLPAVGEVSLLCGRRRPSATSLPIQNVHTRQLVLFVTLNPLPTVYVLYSTPQCSRPADLNFNLQDYLLDDLGGPPASVPSHALIRLPFEFPLPACRWAPVPLSPSFELGHRRNYLPEPEEPQWST